MMVSLMNKRQTDFEGRTFGLTLLQFMAVIAGIALAVLLLLYYFD